MDKLKGKLDKTIYQSAVNYDLEEFFFDYYFPNGMRFAIRIVNKEFLK